MKYFKKVITFSILFALVALSPSFITKARDSYNYSSWGKAVPSAIAMSHKQTIDENALGIRLFEPKDVYVHGDYIYIIDGRVEDANNIGELHGKIIKLNKNFELVAEFPSEDPQSPYYYENFMNSEDEKILMKNPQGIFVNDDFILVADYGNKRLLKLSHNFEFIEEFNEIEDVFFTVEGNDYLPKKVVVDKAGRIYVIAQDAFEGIIELNSDGTFNRYTGVNKISVNPIEIFWNQFKTDEQLVNSSLYLPTSFNNLTLNKMGFLYATSNNEGDTNTNNVIQAINPKGIDVLKRNSFIEPIGDVIYMPGQGENAGPSRLIDITVNDYGLYTVLDANRNRLFTYDEEGNLLYISGGEGNQEGMFNSPVAISYYGEEIIIVDKISKTIVVYEPTHFGQLVNKASKQYYDGLYEEAAETWRDVIKYNTNYEIAYVGIGKALYREDKYEEAMINFKLGNDRDNYSKAFKEYRNEFIREYFSLFMGVALVGIGIFFYGAIKTNMRLEAEDGKEA